MTKIDLDSFCDYVLLEKIINQRKLYDHSFCSSSPRVVLETKIKYTPLSRLRSFDFKKVRKIRGERFQPHRIFYNFVF